MKKQFLIIGIFLALSLSGNAQQTDTITANQALFDSLLVEGIREFHKDIYHSDYAKAVDVLQKAVALQPQNAKAHYYLGYAYNRLNAKEGSTLNKSKKELCILSSNEMEKVIQLDSNYGADLILSPYSKITSDWGSLALSYLSRNEDDSAKWALKEGKERGGFSDFFLRCYRLSLDQCSPDAILFSYGDNNFFNILYLQLIENYRTDVSIVDMGLINTLWYQKMLLQRKSLDFEESPKNKQNYYLVSYSDTLISIPIKNTNRFFSWNFVPRGNNPYYLTYGDRAFKSIITTNKFNRAVFFTYGFPKSAEYNLYYNFEDHILIYRVNPFGKSDLDTETYNTLARSFIDIIPSYNAHCFEERMLINSIRRSILIQISKDWSSTENQDNARYLLKLLLNKLPASKYPYNDKETEIYVKRFKRIIIDEY